MYIGAGAGCELRKMRFPDAAVRVSSGYLILTGSLRRVWNNGEKR